jgi:hypothetical protein
MLERDDQLVLAPARGKVPAPDAVGAAQREIQVGGHVLAPHSGTIESDTFLDQLVFPDYPGNAMFNTLGNLAEYPRAGLLFVDFTTGDVLQITARAHVEPDFDVRLDVDEVRETRAASPLRFRLVEYSPAIPRRS